MSRIHSQFIFSILPVVLFAIGGCESATRPRDSLTNTASKADNLNTAMSELRRSDRNDIDITRAFNYLNQWAEQGGSTVSDWEPEPLLKGLPPDLVQMAQDSGLNRTDFPLSDSRHLNEAIWTRETTRWVSQQAPPPRFKSWLEEIGQKQGVDLQEQLKVALCLFDWTMRNIRLEPLLPPPPPPVATAGKSRESQLASFRGIPGPGYTHLPWQIQLFSRGDAWQRGWLFLLLARQAGIEGVMFAIEPESNLGEPVPWLPALLIGGEWYLFDAELGLPLLNDSKEGVLTWKELQAQPELLKRYDLAGIADYRVQASDLKRVAALIVASPEALSSRMLALERSLKGEHHLQLTVPVKLLSEKLTKNDGITRLKLWTIPWEAIAYEITSRDRREGSEIAKAEFLSKYGMYYNWTPIMQARQRHIRGIFESVDQQPGARDLYIMSRAPNREMNLVSASSEEIALVMQHAKEDATFFLALTHYEQGNYQLAAEWFRDRIVDGAADSPWLSAARYNLGRCYEAEGKFELARDQYLIDTDSPQRVGNILRAGLLKEVKK